MPPTSAKAFVERVDSLAYNVRSFRFKLVDPPVLDFKPGQFMIVNVPEKDKVIKRAYSIALAPHESGILEFCIQHVEGGVASAYFWKLQEGNEISLSGPHGRFFLKEPLEYDPVFVATGTGIAPLRSMIHHLTHINVVRDIFLLFGCRYEHALLYDSEFRTLASARHNFHYHPIISRPKEWKGDVGHVQELFKKYINNRSNIELYLCGRAKNVKSIIEDLQSFSIPKDRLHYEEWG